MIVKIVNIFHSKPWERPLWEGSSWEMNCSLNYCLGNDSFEKQLIRFRNNLSVRELFGQVTNDRKWYSTVRAIWNHVAMRWHHLFNVVSSLCACFNEHDVKFFSLALSLFGRHLSSNKPFTTQTLQPNTMNYIYLFNVFKFFV